MKNKTLGLLLLDMLCAALLSLGTALIVLPALGLQARPLLLFLAIVLLLAFFLLGEKRPWLPPALLGGGVLLLLAGALFLGKWQELIEGVSGFVRWAIAETQISGSDPQLAVYLVISAPITLAFWLLMRRFPTLLTVTLLSAGLVGYSLFCGQETWPIAFLLLCAGNILFLPRKNLKGEERLRAQALAALLAVPVLGLSIWTGPGADGEWRSKTLGYAVQDLQDLWEFHWGDLPELPITSMRSMGLQPQRDRLGGDMELGEGTVLTGGQRLLLRGQTLETYTGSVWEDQADRSNGNFRLDSLLWQGRKKEALGLALPVQISVPLLDELLIDVNTNLRSLQRTRSLFLPYRTERLTAEENTDELYFDMQGEVYWADGSGKAGGYSVEGRTWNYLDPDFDKNLLLLEKALSEEAEPDQAYGRVAARNLQLPEELPKEIKELAEELTREQRTPYQKAIALRNYFSEGFTYTLKPGSPDPEKDFVADFLEKRQGYCTYYASALTVLCRAAEVPARYVTGYTMVPDGKRYKATQSTAHAWTEIYLENIGWVPLDALLQAGFAQEDPQEEQLPENTLPAPTPTPAPAAAEGETASGQAELTAEQGPDPLMLLWLLPILLAALGLWAAKWLRGRQYRESGVRKKYPRTEDAAEHYYRGLMQLLKLLRLAPQEGETLLDFWSRVSRRLSEGTAVDWLEIGNTMNRLRFGDLPPSEEELQAMQHAYKCLKAYARKNLGILGRLRV